MMISAGDPGLNALVPAGLSATPGPVKVASIARTLAGNSRVNLAAGHGISVAQAASVTLAQNLNAREEVDHAYGKAVFAGTKPLCTPYETGWGGHVACIADPDGHVWEFAHDPGFPLADDATLTLPSLTRPAE